MEKQHLRTISLQVSGLHVREAEGEEKSRTIEGYAVVFGARSVNLTPWSSVREIFEIIEPGAITQELLKRSDVVLTAFHNNEKILGRWRSGEGTLSLKLDGKGLFIRCELPETAAADEILIAIERGDISGMSFAFKDDSEDSENGVSYERMTSEDHDGKQVWVRHVKRIIALYDVTIAGHPAYTQTTVSQRESIDQYLDGFCKEEKDIDEREREKALMRAREISAAQRRCRERELEDYMY